MARRVGKKIPTIEYSDSESHDDGEDPHVDEKWGTYRIEIRNFFF